MPRLKNHLLRHLQWLDSKPIAIPVEDDIFPQPLGTLAFLDPLAPSRTRPQAFQKSKRTALGIGQVVCAHDPFDGLCSFLGVVEWDDRDVVVENVGLDDAVEQGTADETEVAVDGRCSAGGESPCFRSIVGNGWVCMLQVRDSNFNTGVSWIIAVEIRSKTYLASG